VVRHLQQPSPCALASRSWKQQIDRIAQRIEALGRLHLRVPQLGVVFQMPGQTVEEARTAHALSYPEDDVDTMMGHWLTTHDGSRVAP
jgi:hypothetical protein